jgi:hypothetical protein
MKITSFIFVIELYHRSLLFVARKPSHVCSNQPIDYSQAKHLSCSGSKSSASKKISGTKLDCARDTADEADERAAEFHCLVRHLFWVLTLPY